jgi:hypothetical protein
MVNVIQADKPQAATTTTPDSGCRQVKRNDNGHSDNSIVFKTALVDPPVAY